MPVDLQEILEDDYEDFIFKESTVEEILQGFLDSEVLSLELLH